jgi:hypothetical protein
MLLLADLLPWQIKSGHGAAANHFRFSEIVSSPEIKNISLRA